MARILIVEPHPDIREYLALSVSRLGHDPAIYEGNEAAFSDVDLALVEPFDTGGLEVAKALRGQGLPLIFESIYPPTEATTAMQPAAYLVKPFGRATLEQAIRAALATS